MVSDSPGDPMKILTATVVSVLVSGFGAPRMCASAEGPRAAQFAAAVYSPPTTKANVRPYTVAANLSNVANLARMNGAFRFTTEQKKLLAKNAFVVAPSTEEQLFFIYENNDYLNLPSFISTDAVLQVYHVFFDFTLRNVEQTKLIGELDALSRGLAEASARQLAAASDADVRDAARRNLAYVTVARKLLDPKTDVPAAVGDVVAKEVALVEAHAGRSLSPLLGDSEIELDYSQFVPRGHYTRAPELGRYFKAMMWYGLVPFPLESAKTGAPSDEATLRALLLTAALFDGGCRPDRRLPVLAVGVQGPPRERQRPVLAGHAALRSAAGHRGAGHRCRRGDHPQEVHPERDLHPGPGTTVPPTRSTGAPWARSCRTRWRPPRWAVAR